MKNFKHQKIKQEELEESSVEKTEDVLDAIVKDSIKNNSEEIKEEIKPKFQIKQEIKTEVKVDVITEDDYIEVESPSDALILSKYKSKLNINKRFKTPDGRLW